ncbi:MAG: hypothetical protein R3C05_03415 [Pirellulaceae bacterium]
MNRISLSTAILIACSVFASAQNHSYDDAESIAIAQHEPQCEVVTDAWARFHGFLFRRYAGSVEMESKTPYPKDYFGRFTYLPWSPDWVKTPANRIRESQYRHHHRGGFDPHYAPSTGSPLYQPLTPEIIAPPDSIPMVDDSTSRNDRLRDVEVLPLQ